MEQTVVIIVDESNDQAEAADISRNDLEGNSAEQTRRLVNAISQFAQVVVYTDPGEFEKNITAHLHDIIFPMYYGKARATSKSIVPALCEALHLCYVGADAYAQIVCNDKALSKQYAGSFGIPSPNGILLRTPQDISLIVSRIKHLSLPLVVKPNFGGGSTGISVKNIVQHHEEAAFLAMQLYKYLSIPILVEEYIEGYEVELIMAGRQQELRFCEEVQLLMEGKEYFKHELWGFETKRVDDSSVNFKMSHHICEADKQRLIQLFLSFSKAEMMRIDGRIQAGKFYLIELSPDCYLGDDCAFYYAFQQKGYSHPQMLQYLIENSLNHG